MQIGMKAKKAFDIATRVFAILLVVFTVFIMVFTIFSVSTVDQNDRVILGHRFYIVRTDSMSPSENNKDIDVHFNAGDIVIIKNAKDPTVFESGDIISFLSTNTDTYGETITHMIREPKLNGKGELIGYVTYGTNTNTNDEKIVEPAYVLGSYAGKLPGVGRFFAFVKSTPGYIVCILVPFLLLIAYNGANVIHLFRRYKSEQTAILDEERAKIEEERLRNEQVLRELMALREQLEKKNDENSSENESNEAK